MSDYQCGVVSSRPTDYMPSCLAEKPLASATQQLPMVVGSLRTVLASDNNKTAECVGLSMHVKDLTRKFEKSGLCAVLVILSYHDHSSSSHIILSI